MKPGRSRLGRNVPLFGQGAALTYPLLAMLAEMRCAMKGMAANGGVSEI